MLLSGCAAAGCCPPTSVLGEEDLPSPAIPFHCVTRTVAQPKNKKETLGAWGGGEGSEMEAGLACSVAQMGEAQQHEACDLQAYVLFFSNVSAFSFLSFSFCLYFEIL